MKRFAQACAALLMLTSALAAESGPSLTQRAEEALFVQSDSQLALQLAKSALKRNRRDAEAAFVAMESAALQADDGTTLDAALTVLTELDGDDVRSEVATARVQTLAANSATFRNRLARIQKLVAIHPQLRLALVSAASDGAPELNQLTSSRDAGLITDWRVAGPFGHNPLLDFDKTFAPEENGLRAQKVAGRTVEQFQFASGRFSLPNYFSRRGVFYAASEIYVPSDGMWNVFLETAGTARVTVDGTPSAHRDERQPAESQLVRSLVHLSQGKHWLLVKFTPSASPFRVAILPPSGSIRRKQNIPVLTASPESEYATASVDLSRGNLVEALRHANAALQMQDSAAVRWLLARCWKQVSEDSPEQEAQLRAALQLEPAAARLQMALGQIRLHADRTQEGLALIRKAAASVPANELLLRIEVREFSRLAWREEATAALNSLVAEHPSCENLSLAAGFYASNEQLTEARKFEDRLLSCSPGSLDGSRALSRRGDHVHAAQDALKVAASEPLNRGALELALRELMLTGDAQAAYPVAQQLAQVAPNATLYQRMLRTVERGATALDEDRGSPLAIVAPFRRDGLEVVRTTADKRYSGGPALWTLNDGAVIETANSRWLYTHRIVRLLNRDGVLTYGEVTVPANAEVLQLRTISAKGQVAEPEFNQHKATVSMPALSPGDSIEEEFLQRLDGDETRFEFGSWDAPILLSRFTLIADPSQQPTSAPALPTTRSLDEGLVASTWEYNDIAQPVRETAVPAASQFPAVYLAGDQASLPEVREHLQEQYLAASVPGPRVYANAARLKAQTQQQTARNLYRFVIRAVDSEGFAANADIATAEESLESHDGDRAATLLALARAAGIEASLNLSRELGSDDRPSSYSHPLVQFHFADGSKLNADLENEGLPLGSTNPSFDLANVLPVIDFASEKSVLPAALTTALNSGSPAERSTADAQVEIAADGSLQASVAIHMGPWRGSQMRGVLRSVAAPDRLRFFQQLAMRLFPGSTDASGNVVNENDPDLPLTIHVTCSAPNFVDLRRHSVDIDQITPALGLRSMYAKSSTRKFPMEIDAVLFESSVFRVSLPEGVTISNGLQADVRSEFGSYATSIRQLGSRTWEMKRDFNIPMQVIAPEHYPAFSAFANRIDAIERQRVTLKVNRAMIQTVRMDQ